MNKFYTLVLSSFLLVMANGILAQNVEGFVTHDINYDGFDGGDPGIGGIRVDLFLSSDLTTSLANTTTAADGSYSIPISGVGDYRVLIDGTANNDGLPYYPTRQDEGGDGFPDAGTTDSDIEFNNGQSGFSPTFTITGSEVIEVDAGFFAPPNISGIVWADLNGNGDRDDGDPNTAQTVTIELYDDATGTIANDISGAAVPAANTTGAFNFIDLFPGDYYLVFSEDEGANHYISIQNFDGGDTDVSDGNNDSDPDRDGSVYGTVGQTYTFNLESDESFDNISGGYFETGEIGDLVWLDDNGNGIDDDGPLPLSIGIDINLLDDTGAPAVDANGNPIAGLVGITDAYLFDDVPPGDYIVEFVEAAGIHITQIDYNGGNTDATDDPDDSDADPITGQTHVITVVGDAADPNNMKLDIDAGLYEDIRITGLVWNDENGNGLREGPDGPFPEAVSIELRDQFGNIAVDPDGNPIGAINHDGSGVYEFFPVPPGLDYYITFEVNSAPDWYLTLFNEDGANDQATDTNTDNDADDANNGETYRFTLTSNVHGETSGAQFDLIDAGYFYAVTIGELVWLDENGNGEFDGAENGMTEIVTINLFDEFMNPVNDADGNPAGPYFSDATGAYLISPLRPGTYKVQFVLPSPSPCADNGMVQDWYYTTPDFSGATDDASDIRLDSDATIPDGNTHNIILTSDIATMGEDNVDINAGFWQPSSISNFAWEDLNGDGLQDLGEPGLENVGISITDCNGNPVLDAMGNPVPAVTTNGSGEYIFENLPPGEYQLMFTAPGGYFPTLFNINGEPTASDVDNDSDNDQDNGNMSDCIELGSCINNEDVDAGFYRPGVVGNRLFHDANADGIRDPALDNGVAGFTITLTDALGNPVTDVNNNPINPFVSDGSGMYEFLDVRPGEYIITVTPLPMWFFSPLMVNGPMGDDDNDVDPASGMTATFVVEGGGARNDIDIGVYKNIIVGGYVWGEGSGDCMFDLGGTEAGYVDVSVSILDDMDRVFATVLTDVMGMYEFEVPPGDYTIRIDDANFDDMAVLDDLILCTPDGIDPNTDVPLDNNGMANGAGAITDVIELLCGYEPEDNGTRNKTIDFGFEFDCGSQNNAFAWFTCDEAADNPICNANLLSQACATMINDGTAAPNPQGPSPLCPGGGGVPHNVSWFSFIAGFGDYDLEIALSGCNPGPGGGTSGIQSGLYLYDPDNANCWGSESPYCEDGCNGGNIILPGEDLIPGQQYLMFLDGCNGSYCGYNINILGTFIPFIAPDGDFLACNGQTECDVICPGTTLDFEAFEVAGSEVTYAELENLNFHWVLFDAGGGILEDWNTNPDFITTESTFSYTFPDVGVYTLCLDEITDPCDNIVEVDLCREITVIDIDDEDFGIVEICENELINYNGPMTVNDDPFETDDPNGDGITGWQIPGSLFPGENTGSVTNAIGCEYEQTVEIIELLNQGVELIDTAVCGQAALPFTMLDDYPSATLTITGSVSPPFTDIVLPMAAGNGCDSIVDVEVFVLDIEGEVVNNGCTADGFALEFVLEDPVIDFDQDIIYTWLLPNGDPIPDDGDGNPFTIIVPAVEDIYTFSVSMNLDFLDQEPCVFDFTHDLDTDGVLPTPPNALNWDLEICADSDIQTYIAESSDPDVTFTWVVPGDVTSSVQDNDTLRVDWTGSAGGDIGVYITNACGDSDTTIQTIVLVAAPTASFNATGPVCVDSNSVVTYDGDVIANAGYNWNFGTGVINAGGTGPGPHLIAWTTPGRKEITTAVLDRGCTSPVFADSVDVVAPVDPPTVSCTSDRTSVTFTWDDPDGLDFYEVLVTTGQSGTLTGNTYTITGLSENEIVEITLTTKTTSPCGDLISTGSCVTQNCVPAEVTPTNPEPICAPIGGSPDYPIDLTSQIEIETGRTGVLTFAGNGIVDPAGLFDPLDPSVVAGNNVINVTFTEDVLGQPCVRNVVLTVNVNLIPTSDFIVDMDNICVDSTLTVEYTGTATTGGNFQWNFGDVETNGNGAGPFDLKWLTPGEKNISLVVTRANCESEPFDLDVTIDPALEPLDIDCAETNPTDITFSWNEIANSTDYTILVNGSTINTTDTEYFIDGLDPEDEVTIEVIANSANNCASVMATETCTAVNCPAITLTPSVNDTTICLDAGALPFDIDFTVEGGLGTGDGVGVWSGNGITDPDGTFDPTEAGLGNHLVTLTFTEGTCEETEDFRVIITDKPVATFDADPVICVTDDLQINFTGSNGLMKEWDLPSGVTIDDTNPNNITASFNSDGIYTIGLIVGTAACRSDQETIEVQVDPELDLTDVTCVQTLSSVEFNWTDIDCADEYEISIDGSVIQTNTDLTFLSDNLAEGEEVTISVLPITTCACPATPVELTCRAQACPPVEISLSSPNPSFCEGVITTAFQLDATVTNSEGPGTGTWSGTNVSDSGMFDPNGLAPGVYTATYDYNEAGCDFSEEVSIEIFAAPTAEVDAVDPTCYLENVGSITTTAAGGDGNYTYRLDGNDTGANTENVAPGPHVMVVSDGNTCNVTVPFEINGTEAAQISISGPASIIKNESGNYTLNINQIDGTVDSVVWSDGTVGNETSVVGNEDQQLCATLFYNDGCSVQTCVDIRVQIITDIVFPNVITFDPVAEGINSTFFVNNFEGVELVKSMRIFDRWGNMVFSIDDVPPGVPESGWNGTLNGKGVASGVYVYKIELQLRDEGVKQYTGDVTVTDTEDR